MLKKLKKETLEGLKLEHGYASHPEVSKVYDKVLDVELKTVSDCYLVSAVVARAERYYYASGGLHPERKAHLKESLDEALKHLTTLKRKGD